MTMTIGRATRLRPRNGGVVRDGRNLTVEGTLLATNGNYEVQATRQQLLGLIDNDDEPVIPVTWDGDATIDGFYTVNSVHVEPLATTRSGVIRWSVSLTQVPGYAQALFEMTILATKKVNSLSLPTTATAGSFGIGSSNIGSELSPNPQSGTALYFAGDAAGAQEVGVLSVAYATTPPATFTSRWFCPPASFYLGSARIEVIRNSVAYPLVGRQMDAMTTWRISNGILRIDVSTSNAIMTVGTYDVNTHAWVDRTFSLGVYDTGIFIPLSGVQRCRVLRNAPETVAVRVPLYGSSFSTYTGAGTLGIYLDITLRRGQRHASFNLVADIPTSTFSFTGTWGVQSLSNPAISAAGAGGVQETSYATGVKFVVGTSQAHGSGTSPWHFNLTSTAATSFPFMIGSILQSDSVPETGASIIDRWINSYSETQRVISR